MRINLKNLLTFVSCLLIGIVFCIDKLGWERLDKIFVGLLLSVAIIGFVVSALLDEDGHFVASHTKGKIIRFLWTALWISVCAGCIVFWHIAEKHLPNVFRISESGLAGCWHYILTGSIWFAFLAIYLFAINCLLTLPKSHNKVLAALPILCLMRPYAKCVGFSGMLIWWIFCVCGVALFYTIMDYEKKLSDGKIISNLKLLLLKLFSIWIAIFLPWLSYVSHRGLIDMVAVERILGL